MEQIPLWLAFLLWASKLIGICLAICAGIHIGTGRKPNWHFHAMTTTSAFFVYFESIARVFMRIF